MKIRRCAVLYLEPREELNIDWASLLAGGGTLAASVRWLALAPHLDREIDIDLAEVAALGSFGQTIWIARDACEQRHGAAIGRLLELGLPIGDAPEYAVHRERDETLRAQHGRPMSALAHTYARWDEVRIDSGAQFANFQELLDSYGPPPSSAVEPGAVEAEITLPAPSCTTRITTGWGKPCAGARCSNTAGASACQPPAGRPISVRRPLRRARATATGGCGGCRQQRMGWRNRTLSKGLHR
jgi:hypothetical protein